MPATPEIGDGLRGIRQAEVLHVFEAEDAPHADGHVGIAREIEINLKRIQKNAKPCGDRRRGCETAVQNLRGDLARRVGQKHLFCKAHAETRRAVKRLGGVELPVINLRGNVRIADNGPGDQLRKKRDIKQKLCKRALRRHITAPNIDRIGKRLKGIEGNADGQRNLRDGQRNPEECVQVFHKKACIFENCQTAEIQYQRQNQEDLFPPAFDEQPKAPVDRNGGDHQKQIDRLTPRIENQAEYNQHRIFGADILAEKVKNQTDRQKQIQKNQVGKDHGTNAPASTLIYIIRLF